MNVSRFNEQFALGIMVLTASGCGLMVKDGNETAENCYHEEGSTPTGYEYEEGSWACQNNPISDSFKLNHDTFYTKLGVTSTTIAAVADDVVGDWNSLSADVTITRSTATTSSNTLNGTDSVQAIYVDTKSPDVAGSLAHTACDRDPENPERYIGCDMRIYQKFLNGDTISWSTSSTPSPSQHSLPYVLAHELGHVLGLDDNKLGDSTSLMHESVDPGDPYAGPKSVDSTALIWVYGT